MSIHKSSGVLEAALDQLARVAGGRSVVKTSGIPAAYLEPLVENGFLEEIIRGWMAVNPKPEAGRRVADAWPTVYWEFIVSYMNDRFGRDWVLSPEASVLLLSGSRSIPGQLILLSPKAGNDLLNLPGSTSTFLYRAAIPDDPCEIDGIRAMRAEDTLVRLSPTAWRAMETDVARVLAMVRGSASLLKPLLEEGRGATAGRIAGALRATGRERDADDVVRAMRAAGHIVREENPFAPSFPEPAHAPASRRHPAAVRIGLLWEKMRGDARSSFDLEPVRVDDIDLYMADVEDRYVADAYNSLSIEGYDVSEELIERVRFGDWNPVANRNDGNALAARGYWLAYREVKDDIRRILSGDPAGPLLWDRHQDWFRRMLDPSVAAGILHSHDLAGYRSHAVFLRGSSHVPMPHEALPDAMEILFDCVAEEEDPRVKAVLAPFLFTYIHPFHDGNGRTGRLLMNALMAGGGFPWTVVPCSRRGEYLACLESVSKDEDIRPLASFIKELATTPPPPRPSETSDPPARPM